jgi:hypothetical protein
MFAVVNSAPDLGMGDDTQGGSLVSSILGPPRSDFENFAADSLTPREASHTSSVTNGKWPIKTPGVLRTGDAALMRNGQPTLPAERPFTIQIGWRLFRLPGASIMSDGKQELGK